MKRYAYTYKSAIISYLKKHPDIGTFTSKSLHKKLKNEVTWEAVKNTLVFLREEENTPEVPIVCIGRSKKNRCFLYRLVETKIPTPRKSSTNNEVQDVLKMLKKYIKEVQELIRDLKY